MIGRDVSSLRGTVQQVSVNSLIGDVEHEDLHQLEDIISISHPVAS